MANKERGSDYIQSLERGMAVLTAFSGEHREMTLTDIAHLTNLTRATARRILLTLQELGYVASEGRLFRLTPKVLDVGYSYLSSLGLGEIAEPYMEQLVAELEESCSGSVLDGTEIVYVVRVPTKRIMTVSLAPGSRLPAYCTSMGRVLLAGLSDAQVDERLAASDLVAHTSKTVTDPMALREIIQRVRSVGWAMVDGELEIGVRSLSAPIRSRSGTTLAAVNVSTHPSRVTLDQLRSRFLPLLLDTAQAISERYARR